MVILSVGGADILVESAKSRLEVRSKMKCICVCLCCATLTFMFTVAQPLKKLSYALFTSSVESPYASSRAVPAIELAEEEILRDQTILEGYILTHTSVEDTLVW